MTFFELGERRSERLCFKCREPVTTWAGLVIGPYAADYEVEFFGRRFVRWTWFVLCDDCFQGFQIARDRYLETCELGDLF